MNFRRNVSKPPSKLQWDENIGFESNFEQKVYFLVPKSLVLVDFCLPTSFGPFSATTEPFLLKFKLESDLGSHFRFSDFRNSQ